MTLDKLKFGTREVIATAVAVLIYVGAECLQRYGVSLGYVTAASYDYFKLRVLVTCTVAAIFGPIVGVIVAVGAAMIVNVLFYGNISMIEVAAYIINGLAIGCYYEKFGVLEGKFKGIRFIDFNVVQALANLFCSTIFTPLLYFLGGKMSLTTGIVKGYESAVGNIIGVAVFGTIILWLTSCLINKNKKGAKYQKVTKV